MNAAVLNDYWQSPDAELIDHAAEAALADLCDPIDRDDAIFARLAKLGVKGEALADLHVAPVSFDGDRFEFARNLDAADLSLWRRSVVATIIPARGNDGDAFDLIAWNVWTGAAATWRGEASLLGNIGPWRLGDAGLRVYPTVLAWLRAQRDGIVILAAAEARWRLIGESLIVDDAEFGASLEAAMRLPEPKVFVRAA